jgi:hypothetical protein
MQILWPFALPQEVSANVATPFSVKEGLPFDLDNSFPSCAQVQN